MSGLQFCFYASTIGRDEVGPAIADVTYHQPMRGAQHH